MSVNATAAASAAASIINLHHNHKKAVHLDSLGSGTATSGQAPATTQGLFSSLLKTIEQVAGVSPLATAAVAAVKAVTATTPVATSAPAATPATTTAAATTSASTQTQNVQSFVHSLFQALKADGLGAGATGEAAASASTGTATAGTAGHYEGSLISSLQTLIQQVQTGGAATPATAGLAASYDQLVQGAGGATATTASAATQPSTASLTHFLANLLQTVQSGGAHSLSALGATVDTKV